MNDEKTELVKKAIKKDQKALEQLVRQEQKNIYTTLFYLKKDENELSDIMQDVLIKLSKKISQLRNPNNFKTWLNQIILNTYYDYLRKNRNNKFKNKPEDENNRLQDVPDLRRNPQDRILYSELDYVIKNSIDNLPMHYKIPISLREIQGLPPRP